MPNLRDFEDMWPGDTVRILRDLRGENGCSRARGDMAIVTDVRGVWCDLAWGADTSPEGGLLTSVSLEYVTILVRRARRPFRAWGT